MHKLWEIATKRGGNDKGSNEQSDVVPPSKDVFESFMYGLHGKQLFISQFREIVMCCDALVDTDHQAGYWSTFEQFLLDNLNPL